MGENKQEGNGSSTIQPGDLNRYIRVTTTSVWLVLAAVLVFAVGLAVWAMNTKLTVSIGAVAVVKDSKTTVYIPEDKISSVRTGDAVHTGATMTTLQGIPTESIQASEVLDEYQRSLQGIRETDKVVACEVQTDLPDGSYNATIVQEQIVPIRFLFGKSSKK
jgi:hypothetical protein